jgi:hypothetical protein
MGTALMEGRCKQCGYRVTLERGAEYHRAPDGRRCGPVEVHRPDHASDHPSGRDWVAR